ncbi:MAG: hypothetical protein K0M78_02845 [Brevundimonas sp.]|nr:hypothetical protein [Brevundimonas sp.]
MLGWQIVAQPLLQRAPYEIAIRLGPTSPQVLLRAAEGELAAGRNDNARALAADALSRSPFDVRALRVVGLTEARAGRNSSADDILTLAGNWSLRDGPAHAWLIERRLRRGDYASAFAHADLLVRRREELQPQVFRLFTVAGAETPQRALPVIAKLLAANPPWRKSYLESLNKDPQGLQVAINLAVLLQSSRAPFSNLELQTLYLTLYYARQLDAVRILRTRLNRPSTGVAVTNGNFDDPVAPQPFQWQLAQQAGVVTEIVSDDRHPDNLALRVDYDGYASAHVAEQLIFIPAGSHRFTAAAKIEAGDPANRLAWTVTCHSGELLAKIPGAPPAAEPNTWTSLSASLVVPAACPVQWLRLATVPADQRSPTVVWFDKISLSPVD